MTLAARSGVSQPTLDAPIAMLTANSGQMLARHPQCSLNSRLVMPGLTVSVHNQGTAGQFIYAESDDRRRSLSLASSVSN